jgi:putative ABC transport system permease protein
MSDHPRPTRLARLLALCYPRDLREQYADDIARFIDDRRRDPEFAGRPLRWLSLAGALAADAGSSMLASLVHPRSRAIEAPMVWRAPFLPPPRSSRMETVLQDVRYAVRSFVRRPGFTAIAIVTLVLGIGANSAIFTLVNAVLLRPLPYPEPEQLVAIWGTGPGQPRTLMTIPDVVEMRRRNHTFAELGVLRSQSVNLTGGDRPDRLIGSFVEARSLHLLAARAEVGRLFLTEETEIGGGQPVAVLSYPTWQTRFGGRPDIVGTTVVLNGRPHEVIGVMARDFYEANPSEIWLPITSAPNRAWFERPNSSVWAVGRLRPGFTAVDGQRDLSAIAADLARVYPESNASAGVSVVDMHESIMGSSRFMLLVLFGAVCAVLLIVCVNIANLQLARASTRQREMSLRAALGADRGRLVRQVLTESVLLSLVGGGLGVLFGRWALQLLVASMPTNMPISTPPALDPTTLLFSLGLAVLTGLLFGAPAALYGTRTELQGALRGRTGEAGSRRFDLRNVLVAAELALCIVLLAGAGLFTRSLVALQRIDIGFAPEHVLSAELRLPSNKYDDSVKVVAFMGSALERLRDIPGVESAALVDAVPLSGNFSTASYVAEGQQEPEPGMAPSAGFNLVSDGYFQTMKIPLLAGRDFDRTDTPESEFVVVVSSIFAERAWPGQSAVGRTIKFLDPEVTARVIGVVGPAKQMTLSEPPMPQIYGAKLQAGGIFASIVMRTAGDPEALTNALSEAIWSVDRDQPVWKIRSLESLVRRDLAPARFSVGLIGAFAGLALLLSVIGVYGVMSFVVTQRSREVGIRMALGARAGQVVRLVLRRGVAVVGVASVIGIAGALAAGRYLESRLYDVGGADPLTMIAVPIVLGAAALLACWVPARRAARVDPAVTLRTE